MWIERGEHVCLIGPNGSGKSTLVEALVGRRELDGGGSEIGHNVEVGYLSQHAELPHDDTAHRARPRPVAHGPLGGEDAGAPRPVPVLRATTR